jgi:hypothetical protein
MPPKKPITVAALKTSRKVLVMELGIVFSSHAVAPWNGKLPAPRLTKEGQLLARPLRKAIQLIDAALTRRG